MDVAGVVEAIPLFFFFFPPIQSTLEKICQHIS